jgi:carnitine O-acetyltransferase
MKELSSKETINGEFAPGDKKKDLVTFGSGTHQPQSAQSLLSSKSSYDSIGSITYGSQGLLPRLPIPTLEETLEKFPKVLEALQDEQEREETKRVVEEFLAGPGPVLQQALMDYEAAAVEAGGIGSYVEEFWNESYLAGDSSVVLNLNPFFVLEEGPDPKIAKDQLHRAASLCFAALKLASQLKDETIPPDTFKGKPLCMDQFKVLFGSSRQPAAHETDDVHVYPDSSHGTLGVGQKTIQYMYPLAWMDCCVSLLSG